MQQAFSRVNFHGRLEQHGWIQSSEGAGNGFGFLTVTDSHDECKKDRSR